MNKDKLELVFYSASVLIGGIDSPHGYDSSIDIDEDYCIAEQVIAMLWGLA